jgi:hypothetical protein
MALQDGTRREPYNEPRDSHGRPAAKGINWSIVVPVALVVALLVSAIGFFFGGQNTVINAPASTPPSVQQPDTTPPANPEPSQ